MRRVIGWCGAAVLAALVGGCGTESVPLDASVDGAVTGDAVGLETVAPESLRAGQTLTVACLLIDADGEAFTAPADVSFSVRIIPEASVERQEDGSWMAVRAGTVEVSCIAPELRLTDETPAEVRITPGDPAHTIARVEPDAIVAGEAASVSCEVFDAWGNRVEDVTPTLRAEPSREQNTFEERSARFTRAGRYDVFCDHAGTQARGAALEVTPNLPASLLIAKVPEQPVYTIGQVIGIERLVHDRYGNLIDDVPVGLELEAHELNEDQDNHGQALGLGRVRYSTDGRYFITASVPPPTADDVPLTATTEVLVDSTGPTIDCESPHDGGILNMTPGTSFTFRGSVNDLSGISSVTVNGASTPVDGDGRFSLTLQARYGINFVDIAAVDSTGREASRTCAFLVADAWSPNGSVLSETISLRLRQPAFDDSDRNDGLDSLADVLHTVLNSRGLRDTLHTALQDANPLKPSSCDERVFGACVLSSAINYRDLEINGPNTTSLTLVDGGLRANVDIRNLRLRVRVNGRAAGISYDTTGWVTFASASVGMIFDTSLASGRPRVTVRPGSLSVSVGSISTSFSGISGAIIDIVASLFRGRVRDMIQNLVRDWVRDNFDEMLDGLLGGLDIDSLGTSFDVPRLDGGDPIPLEFGISFSNLTTSPTRMLFTIGTRFSAPPAHARTTRGAPVRSGTRRLDVSGTQTTGVAVHEAVLNQALHALWRGGFLDADLDASTISGLPEGLRATIATGLPPVALIGSGNRAELQIGAMQVLLDYPDLFAETIRLTLGARASVAVGLSGETFSFSDLRIEEIYFSTDLASLDMATRDTIEGFLRRLLDRVLLGALEGALPAIPVPSFPLPASLAPYGIPSGDLGLVSPTLNVQSPHFVLRGGFAVR